MTLLYGCILAPRTEAASFAVKIVCGDDLGSGASFNADVYCGVQWVAIGIAGLNKGNAFRGVQRQRLEGLQRDTVNWKRELPGGERE